MNAPVILQVSQGGAAFFGGKGLKNDKQQGSIAGAVAMAHFVRAIAPSYGMLVFSSLLLSVTLADENVNPSPVVIHSDHCAQKLLPWFDGEYLTPSKSAISFIAHSNEHLRNARGG